MASPAHALVARKANGQLFGLVPRAGVTPSSIPGSVAAAPTAHAKRFAANGNVEYHAGPVIHSSAPYLVFWDPENAIPAGSRLLLERFFADVAADSGKSSNTYGVLRQYTDGSGFADYRQTFTAAQVINDTQPFPATDAANCNVPSAAFHACVTDLQLQSELSRLISNDGLPAGTGPNAPIYFVVTAPDVNVCTDASDCATNVFCAYHSAFTASTGNVLYASIPTVVLAAGSDPKSCQFDGHTAVQSPNGDLADVVIGYMSHEDSEALTDPVNGTGWWDPVTGNEIGDTCEFTGPANPNNDTNPTAYLPTLGGSPSGTLFDQVINGHPYYFQAEWSNGAIGCQMRPAPGSLTASFTGPAGASPGVPLIFNPAASSSTDGYSSVTWNFGDGSSPIFTGVGGPAQISHAFATPGSYFVTLTLVDPLGNVSTAAQQVFIQPPPTAKISASPLPVEVGMPVAFRATPPSAAQGAIRSYSWSFGDGGNATGAAATHTYQAPGTFSVTLTVSNIIGLSTRVTVTVTVLPRVTAVSLVTRGKHRFVVVKTDGPGVVTYGGKAVRLRSAGSAQFALSLSSAQQNTLTRRGRLSVVVSITFVPAGGQPQKTQQRLTLKA